MGGHGGLNILPQKRWNVYNFDNREKVKKDEEEAARKEAIEKEQARQRDAEFRLEKLREAAQAKKRDTNELRITAGEGEGEGEGEGVAQPALGNGVEEIAGPPQHINLFAGIEVIEPELVTEKQGDGERKSDIKEGRGRDSFTREYKKMKGQEPKVPGPEDAGYEFGFGLIGKSGKRPWYSTKGFMIGRTAGDDGAGSHVMRTRSPVEERREESPEKRRKEKPQKHEKSKKDEKPQNGRKTMDELRAERVKREQQERDKAQKLVVASRKTEANGGVGVNRNGRPYYNQSFGNSR